MPLALEIVTAERVVYADEVDMVTAPGADGELGILPHHAALFTLLNPGELRVRKGNDVTRIAIGGGFLEVHHDRVSILADTAERAEEIDLARAEAAVQRAKQALSEKQSGDPAQLALAEAALRRSSVRLKVARRRGGDGPPPQM